jgi:chromosome segregation ATPase
MTEERASEATYDEGVRKLESMLAGTRMHATRALKELHQRMVDDLIEAERRARRAERLLAKSRTRTQQVRTELKKTRERARKAERRARRLAAKRRHPAAAPGPSGSRVARVLRRVRARRA